MFRQTIDHGRGTEFGPTGGKIELTTAIEAIDTSTPEDLVLHSDEEIAWNGVSLKIGQTGAQVRPASGRCVVVPAADSWWTAKTYASKTSTSCGITNRTRPIVRVDRRGCLSSKRISPGGRIVPSRAAAIRRQRPSVGWATATRRRAARRIDVRRLRARGVAAMVECPGGNGLSVEMRNTLCVSCGPIVRLHRAMARDQALAISLDHTTTRGESAVLEWRCARQNGPCGAVAITVTESA